MWVGEHGIHPEGRRSEGDWRAVGSSSGRTPITRLSPALHVHIHRAAVRRCPRQGIHNPPTPSWRIVGAPRHEREASDELSLARSARPVPARQLRLDLNPAEPINGGYWGLVEKIEHTSGPPCTLDGILRLTIRAKDGAPIEVIQGNPSEQPLHRTLGVGAVAIPSWDWTGRLGFGRRVRLSVEIAGLEANVLSETPSSEVRLPHQLSFTGAPLAEDPRAYRKALARSR